MTSSVKRIMAAINADPALPAAEWWNTGGGCMAIHVRLGEDTDWSHILVGDYGDGPFSQADLDSDDHLTGVGFGVGRYDAESEAVGEIFHARTVEEVVAEVRNLVRYFVPTPPKAPEMVTERVVVEVTYDKHRVTPGLWAVHHLTEAVDGARVTRVTGVGQCGRCPR